MCFNITEKNTFHRLICPTVKAIQDTICLNQPNHSNNPVQCGNIPAEKNEHPNINGNLKLSKYLS